MWEQVDNAIQGLQMILSWGPILALSIGILIGFLVGAVPGLTVTMTIAMLMPITFQLSPLLGIPMCIGIWKGGLYSGAIPAILVSTPGTGGAVATMLDGYPMAKQGLPTKALQTSLVASTAGDAFSDLMLLLFMAPIAAIALLFGAPEYFALYLMSLVLIAALMGQSVVKGLFSAFLGLLISTVGIESVTGSSRFTFGNVNLMGGITFMTMMIGLFAVGEVLRQAEGGMRDEPTAKGLLTGSKNPEDRLTLREAWSLRRVILQSSLIGTGIGVVPGLGAPIAAFLAYAIAQRSSRHPEAFGKGSLEGIAAPESANNAVNGANFIPLLAFGIPGDIIAAVMLGAFLAHGLRPGPDLFQDHAVVMFAIIWSMVIGNGLLLLFGWFLTHIFAKVILIPKRILFPSILAVAVIGSYSLNSNLFDVQCMFFFGFVGYGLTKLGIPLPPLIITALLSRGTENSLVQSLIVLRGDFTQFIHHPLALSFFAVAAIVLGLVAVKGPLWKEQAPES